MNFTYRIHPSTTKPNEHEAGRVANVYRIKTVEIAHFVATVGTRMSPYSMKYENENEKV